MSVADETAEDWIEQIAKAVDAYRSHGGPAEDTWRFIRSYVLATDALTRGR